MLGLVSGILTPNSPLSRSAEISIASEPRSYLVQVKDVRYPQVGEVEFVGTVLQTMTPNTDKIVPFSARFRAIHLAWRNSAVLQRDSVVVVYARLQQLSEDDLPWGFDAHLRRHGVAAQGVAELISEPLTEHETGLAGESADKDQAHGVVWSLAVGNRDVVSRDLEQQFRRLGLSHVLVFSGFQVMLVGGLVTGLVKRILVGAHSAMRADILALLIGLGSSMWLTALSGWEPSGVRAVVAFVYLAATHLFQGANSSAGQKISIGVIGVSLVFPGAIFEPGVQLTFAALLGLLAAPTGGLVVPAVTATIFTSFVGLIWFGQWTPIGFLLNPILPPVLTVTGCLLAYPALLLEGITEYLGVFSESGSDAVKIVGELNIWIITSIGQFVPRGLLLEPKGASLILTLLVLGGVILAILVAATMRYFMRNGVAFREAA